MLNVNYIEKPEQMSLALEKILAQPVLGIDTETTGYTTRIADISLMQISTSPVDVHVLNVRRLLDAGQDFQFLFDTLKNDKQIKIMQNAKFDLQFMQKLLGRRLRVRCLNDTMLSSMLLAFGDKSVRHGLGKISEREIGEEVDKSLQSSDFSGPNFSTSQIEYAARDAAVLHRIREKQLAKVESYGLKRVARIEFDAVATLAEMEYKGIFIHPKLWGDRIEWQLKRYEDLKQEIYDKYGQYWPVQKLWDEPSINLDSPLQMLEFLNRVGVPIEDTDEDSLKLFEDAHPIMPLILEYREMETAKKKFGESYSRFIDPVDGRVHASFWQIEAPTGRMSARDPNLMQIPKKALYRDAFRSQAEGGKMITADYSQIELRVMARLSGDKALTEAFLNGEDLHDKTAILVLGQTKESMDPEVRVIAKNLNFGTAYGTSPKTFAKLAKISESEAELVMKNYWKSYSGLDKYLTHQGQLAIETGTMRTASGRMGRHRLDMKERKLRGRASRLGRNFSIQGTGADILKTALYEVREAFLDNGLEDSYLVNSVHDELLADAEKDAEKTAFVMEEAMNKSASVFLEHIPSKVDIRIKDQWSK